ncbi:MAG: hypothetical protein L0Y60_17930 [Beijerinckiaceae bacterium]|nr:hypothetical protein [Beijerinckiaceae bacterium]
MLKLVPSLFRAEIKVMTEEMAPLNQHDMDRVRRLTTNLAELLAKVLKAMEDVAEEF